jgi:hypothetical protein
MAPARQHPVAGPSPDAVAAAADLPLTAETLKRLRTAGRVFGVAKDKRVSGRISGDLLAAAKQRLGVASDTEVIELALVHVALADDYGAWLVAQAGRLDADFTLEP